MDRTAANPMTRRSAILGSLLSTLPTASWPTTSVGSLSADHALTAALQALVDDPQHPLASLSLQCIHAGRTVYANQLGRRVIGESQQADLPVTPQTLFRMASVSKMVVALGVLRLVDAGKLDLDADVGQILGLPLRHPRFSQTAVTARMLLSHRASLSDLGGYRFEADVPLRKVLLGGGSHFDGGRSWLAQQPGTYFQYCNFNYGVLASVMELASGLRFDRLMQQEVLAPLGMAGGFDPSQFTAAELANLATLYRKRSADEVWNTNGPWEAQTDNLRGIRPTASTAPGSYVLGSNGTLYSPQGGLRTRVHDMGNVLLMLLQGGEWQGQQFLSAKSVRALLTEQWRYKPDRHNGDHDNGLFQAWGLGVQHFIDRSSSPARTGYGDRLVERGGMQAWGHLGDAYGLVSGAILDPQNKQGVVYVISGVGADPDKNKAAYSSLSRWEAKALDLAWSHVRQLARIKSAPPSQH
jgi:CubicO group peptidase (beta-lactamase class C family)